MGSPVLCTSCNANREAQCKILEQAINIGRISEKVYQFISSREISAAELSIAIETIQPRSLGPTCSAGSINSFTGRACTVKVAISLPSLRRYVALAKFSTIIQFFITYSTFHIFTAPSWPPDIRREVPKIFSSGAYKQVTLP